MDPDALVKTMEELKQKEETNLSIETRVAIVILSKTIITLLLSGINQNHITKALKELAKKTEEIDKEYK